MELFVSRVSRPERRSYVRSHGIIRIVRAGRTACAAAVHFCFIVDRSRASRGARKTALSGNCPDLDQPVRRAKE